MKFVHALLLVNLVFAVSCGKKSSSNGSKEIFIDEAKVNDVMARQTIECSPVSGFSCPDGITRLLIINKKKPERSHICSGFMVGEDTMITNQHCIPDSASCKNTYIAINNGYSHEVAKCSSVVKILKDFKTGDPRKALDVTIVKINKKWSGKTFKAAPERPKDGETVSAWVIDHTGADSVTNPNLYDSRLTEFKCKVRSVTDGESMILGNCPMVPGNSGSPVINNKGEIVGVIWGTTATDIDSSYDLKMRRYRTDYGLATEVKHFQQYFPQ